MFIIIASDMDNEPPFGSGAHPSEPDIRDIKHTEVAMGFPPPPNFNIDYSMIPVENQGKKGICTAMSLAVLIEKLRGDGVRLSWTFLYKVGKRVYDNNTLEGSSLRTMLKVAYNYGIPRYDLAPYDINQSYADFMATPDFPPSVYQDAMTRSIGGYSSVPITQGDLQTTLSSSQGLYIRMEIGNEWYTNVNGITSYREQDISPLRPPQQVISGHAVVVHGYNGSLFTLRNSWGQYWARQGDADFNFTNYRPTEAWLVYMDPIVHTIDQDLFFGMINREVKNLQRALKIEGLFNYNISGYFGALTLWSVMAFQRKYGITPTGYVGMITRTKINQLNY